MIVGGMKPGMKDCEAEHQDLVNKVKAAIEEKADAKYEETFNAVCFTSQVVAGTNFWIKVNHGEGENDHIHVKIFRPLPHTGAPEEVSEVVVGQTREAEF
jgi:cystatin-A/B